jgi:formylglycine-generating enzyme required for sulfatase activity
MEFVLVRAGSFHMGSPDGEPQREPQERLHEVTITSDFYLGRFEVTQEQWSRVMGDNPSRYQECGQDCPVETVNRLRVEDFLSRLSTETGERLRLPTEAEWEYACRAGSDSAFGVGDAISSELANFDGRTPYPEAESGPYRASPTPVGSFPANDWGLHDMNGNVWEWVADEHCPYPETSVVDPFGSCGVELVVIRGGSWHYGPDSARCGLRYTHRPIDDGPSLGFRVVREEPWEGR